MTLQYLSDPIAALIARLSAADSLVRTLGGCATVVGFELNSRGQTVKQRLDPTIELRAAGIGSGAGHAAQAHYESIRVDCLAYDKTNFLVWRLSKLATQDIMNSRNRTHKRTYDGIEYKTRFITIVQSGGPNMFRDEHTDWPVVMTTWSINANSAKLTPAGA